MQQSTTAIATKPRLPVINWPALKRFLTFYTVGHKKACQFILDHNSHFLVDFTILMSMERGMNTLQFTYVVYIISWWRHNCVISHVIKVYFK